MIVAGTVEMYFEEPKLVQGKKLWETSNAEIFYNAQEKYVQIIRFLTILLSYFDGRLKGKLANEIIKSHVLNFFPIAFFSELV